MIDVDRVKYIVTETGGGWTYHHNLFIITSDDKILYTNELDKILYTDKINETDILNCHIQKEYNLYSADLDPSTIVTGIITEVIKGKLVKRKERLSDLLVNGKADFERFEKRYRVVMDSPMYSLYKNVNGKIKLLIRTEDLKGIPAVEYVLSLKHYLDNKQ